MPEESFVVDADPLLLNRNACLNLADISPGAPWSLYSSMSRFCYWHSLLNLAALAFFTMDLIPVSGPLFWRLVDVPCAATLFMLLNIAQGELQKWP